jgi:hypothetical protein
VSSGLQRSGVLRIEGLDFARKLAARRLEPEFELSDRRA